MGVERASYWSLRLCPIAESQTPLSRAVLNFFGMDGFRNSTGSHDDESNSRCDRLIEPRWQLPTWGASLGCRAAHTSRYRLTLELNWQRGRKDDLTLAASVITARTLPLPSKDQQCREPDSRLARYAKREPRRAPGGAGGGGRGLGALMDIV
jgi:hypothetical protein